MIKHKVIGAENVKRRFARAAAATALTKAQVTDEASAMILRRIRERFLAEKDPNLRPWTPLSESTIARRMRDKVIGPGRGILYHSGDMFKAIDRVRQERGISVATGFGFRIGVAGAQEDKARVHQYGTQHVPERPFLGINDLDVRAVVRMLRRRAQGNMKNV